MRIICALLIMIIDNSEKILPILEPWGAAEDFYLIQVIQRQKDIEETKSRKSKVIKEYYIKNKDYFYKKYPEIKKMADFFKARVYINPSIVRSHKLASSLLRQLSEAIDNPNASYTNIVSKAIGQSAKDNKKWIIDIDDPLTEYKDIVSIIKAAPPYNNILLTLDTVTGKHLITRPFNPQGLYKKYNRDIVRKNNPTLLYYKIMNKRDISQKFKGVNFMTPEIKEYGIISSDMIYELSTSYLKFMDKELWGVSLLALVDNKWIKSELSTCFNSRTDASTYIKQLQEIYDNDTT